MILKVQSNTWHDIGTIVYDDDTGEIFRVTKCIKFFLEDNYGLYLEPLTKEVH